MGLFPQFQGGMGPAAVAALRHLPLSPFSTLSPSGRSSTLIKELVLMTFGCGNFGVLGQGGDVVAPAYEPIPVPGLPADIVGVGAGHYSSYSWTAAGQLFTWGRNKEWQLGRPLSSPDFDYSTVPSPVQLGPLARHRVKFATGSGVATFAVTEDGLLFAAGTSKRGQLGLGPQRPQSKEFCRVGGDLSGKVIRVAAGWGHAAALTEKGGETALWTWGWPANGRLGHSFASSDADEAERSLVTRCVWQPRKVDLLEGVKIKDIACSNDATYCLTQDNRILSFGDPSLGQLGRPERHGGEHFPPKDASEWEVRASRESDSSKQLKFQRMTAGLAHCLAVTMGGNVVSWGWAAAQQLGLGASCSADVVSEPTFIYGVAKNRAALVAAGRVHSLLVTDEIDHGRTTIPTAHGRTWEFLTMAHSFGAAAEGRLGTGTYEDAPFPELITELDGEMILDVACGMDHSLILVGREWVGLEGAGAVTAQYPQLRRT